MTGEFLGPGGFREGATTPSQDKGSETVRQSGRFDSLPLGSPLGTAGLRGQQSAPRAWFGLFGIHKGNASARRWHRFYANLIKLLCCPDPRSTLKINAFPVRRGIDFEGFPCALQ
jgi:hypothetical protein